jgi:hypothetical protein
MFDEEEVTVERPGATPRASTDLGEEQPVRLGDYGFGEFLVASAGITRFQLFCALQMQDRHPEVRIGECLVALGYLPSEELERQLSSWNQPLSTSSRFR